MSKITLYLNKSGGYIALSSSLVLVAVITVIAFVLAAGSLISRQNATLFYVKKDSRFTAESCLEVARLKMAASSTYSGNETVAVGSSTCSILAIETVSNNKLIKTSSIIQKSRTNLKLTALPSTLEKISLEEAPVF